ncbi:MAG TPA: GTP-binding protein [Candidatus Nanoarchaeia archaeon]|nr:GTP-binding protein [Candidatus Nanoarchaeia archaeon]
MVDYKQKIKELQDELKKTKYNKATQGHVGIVKAKIAQLKERQEQRSVKKTGKSEHGYSVRKSGDATILLLGFPSTGKSTLLNALAGTNSEVAAYAFTTLTVIPGMLEYKQASIQILDVPGIVSGAASGRGRGKEVLAVIKNADLVLMVVEVNHPEHYPAILREVWESGIRLNKTRPEVFIKKKGYGGIQVGRTVKFDLDDETIKSVLREFKIVSADILIRSPIDVDDLIDCIEGNKKYLPAITCISKADLGTVSQIDEVKNQTHADIAVAAEIDLNIELLKELIFQKLDFIRIYMKEPKKEADLKEPLIMKRNATIKTVCEKTHQDFVSRFKFARIWGPSSKFPGQQFRKLNHELRDGDILELHLN